MFPSTRMIVRSTHRVKVGRGYLIGIEKSTRFCGHGRSKRTVPVNLRLCSWQLSLRINCESSRRHRESDRLVLGRRRKGGLTMAEVFQNYIDGSWMESKAGKTFEN